MRLDEAIRESQAPLEGGGRRFWRASERSNPGHEAGSPRMFVCHPGGKMNVQWDGDQWSWPRGFSVEDALADDWIVDYSNDVQVLQPQKREPRSCNRHAGCWATIDAAWPRKVVCCSDEDCEDCFGK